MACRSYSSYKTGTCVAVMRAGRWSLDAPAAIDMDHLAGHVVAVMAGEKCSCSHYVVGVGNALDLQSIADDVLVGLALFFLETDIHQVLVQLFPKRRDNHAGRVTVDSDIVFR